MQPATHPWTQVTVGDVVFVVSTSEPMAVIRRRGAADVIAAWPHLDVGLRTPSLKIHGVPEGVWLTYDANTDMGEPFARPRRAAIHVGVDGTIREIDFHDRLVVGATGHGLWTDSLTDLPDSDDAGQWNRACRLTITTPEGIDSHVTYHGVTVFSRDVNGEASLWVEPSAPSINNDGGYTYRYARIPLPDGPLPETLTLEEAVEYTEAEFMAMLRTTNHKGVAQPRDIPITHWPLVDSPMHDRAMAVDAVVKDFANLDRYWRHEDGSSEPLSTGLADPLVEVLHSWPHTVVQVSFTHPRFALGRMRRSIRIFDDAGRMAPNPHSAILLMEDLEAGPLPPASSAIDGVLEI